MPLILLHACKGNNALCGRVITTLAHFYPIQLSWELVSFGSIA